MVNKGLCCELCSSVAKIFCKSDQTRLCWDCDGEVHAANILVAKHARTALCHVCHSTTPWKASGSNLGRVVSICGVSFARSTGAGSGSAETGGVRAEEEEEGAEWSKNVRIAGEGGSYVQQEELDDDYDDDDSEGDNDEDSDSDDDNLLVPWTSTPPLPATVTSTSCSEDVSSFFGRGGCESVSTSHFCNSAFFFRSNDEIGD